MNPALKLALFAVVLLALFGGGIAIGRAVGPAPSPAHTMPGMHDR